MDINIWTVLKHDLERYDYAAAYELLLHHGVDDKRILNLVDSCKHAMNFDFQSAHHSLKEIKHALDFDHRFQKLMGNIEDLVKGVPNAIFSELLENTRIQLQNERYIDFLSRIYRLKEAILKYLFIRLHIQKNRISFMAEVMSKRSILKILRKKYKVYHPNLSFAIISYIDKYHSHDWRWNGVIQILNAEKMNELMELRNACIAGHGFRGISKKDIVGIYGNTEQILDDYERVLSKIEIHVQRGKYEELNTYILDMISNDK